MTPVGHLAGGGGAVRGSGGGTPAVLFLARSAGERESQGRGRRLASPEKPKHPGWLRRGRTVLADVADAVGSGAVGERRRTARCRPRRRTSRLRRWSVRRPAVPRADLPAPGGPPGNWRWGFVSGSGGRYGVLGAYGPASALCPGRPPFPVPGPPNGGGSAVPPYSGPPAPPVQRPHDARVPPPCHGSSSPRHRPVPLAPAPRDLPKPSPPTPSAHPPPRWPSPPMHRTPQARAPHRAEQEGRAEAAAQLEARAEGIEAQHGQGGAHRHVRQVGGEPSPGRCPAAEARGYGRRARVRERCPAAAVRGHGRTAEVRGRSLVAEARRHGRTAGARTLRPGGRSARTWADGRDPRTRQGGRITGVRVAVRTLASSIAGAAATARNHTRPSSSAVRLGQSAQCHGRSVGAGAEELVQRVGEEVPMAWLVQGTNGPSGRPSQAPFRVPSGAVRRTGPDGRRRSPRTPLPRAAPPRSPAAR